MGKDPPPLPMLAGEGQLIVELFLFHVALPVLLERFRCVVGPCLHALCRSYPTPSLPPSTPRLHIRAHYHVPYHHRPIKLPPPPDKIKQNKKRLRDLIRCGMEHAFAPLCRALGLAHLLDEETLAAARDRRRRQREQRRQQGPRLGPPLPPLAPVRIRPEPPVRAHGGQEEGEDEEAGKDEEGGGWERALRLGALLVASAVGMVLAASFAAQVPVRLGRWLLGRWLGAWAEAAGGVGPL
jgi:hypothetical protein